MAQYQILYWHDIPLQVRAGGRRDRVSQELAPRFQEAIDKAAMAAELGDTDAYLNAFRWTDYQERDGTPEDVVSAVVAELEAQFPTINWKETAARLSQKDL
jgi:hypothetical protein